MKVALFDFDGTITSKDTMFEFLKFARGKLNFYIGMLLISPMLLLYIFKFISAQRAKEITLTFFLKGLTEDYLHKLGHDFTLQKLPLMLKPKAIAKINKHKSEYHSVVIVTASLDIWTSKWCQMNGLDLICSLPEYQNKIFTGKLLGRNCDGDEKLIRIKEKLNLTDFEFIYGYGNTSGDLPMLSICQEKNYRVL